MIAFMLLRYKKSAHDCVRIFGAGNQNRTDDLVITNDVLYRLSHTSSAADDCPATCLL